MTDADIVLITGDRQVGKSTALEAAVAALRHAGLKISGLFTRRVGPHDLEVVEIQTGDAYPLTDPFRPDSSSPLHYFIMNDAAMARSRRALRESFPTDIFVLDELGPLELKHRRGWVEALDLLARETYDLAMVVVRPELLVDVLVALPVTHCVVVRVTEANRDTLPDFLCRIAQAACTGTSEGDDAMQGDNSL
jgi:nucleoside-triphosphatase THEP1